MEIHEYQLVNGLLKKTKKHKVLKIINDGYGYRVIINGGYYWIENICDKFTLRFYAYFLTYKKLNSKQKNELNKFMKPEYGKGK